MYEVGMNIVTEGEKTTPIYEVWKGIVTEGYVRRTKKEPVETGSLELRIAGSMKKI